MTRATQLYEAGLWRVAIVLTALFVAAGGLGVSTSAALTGVLLLPILAAPALRAVMSNPAAPALAGCALAWAALSWTWSPYDRPDQALKLGLLVPAYALTAFAAARMATGPAERRFQWCAVAGMLAGCYFLVEALLGAPVAQGFKIHVEGYGDPEYAKSLADRALARGITGYLLIAGPVALALLSRRTLAGASGAALVGLAAMAGGLAFGVSANLAALAAAVIAAAAAWRWPSAGLGTVCFAAAAAIVSAPLYMGAVTGLLSEDAAASLPLSWHMRLEIWRASLEQIGAAPLIGHGLDATRAMSEEAVLRGMTFDRLPLHPHNAGLQIWLETGFVGAVLFASALAALGRRCMTASLSPVSAAGAAACGAAYLVTVMVGSGVWQEWLHGCLAMGLAAALMSRR